MRLSDLSCVDGGFCGVVALVTSEVAHMRYSLDALLGRRVAEGSDLAEDAAQRLDEGAHTCSGSLQLRRGKRAKSASVEHSVRPCSIASAARWAWGRDLPGCLAS